MFLRRLGGRSVQRNDHASREVETHELRGLDVVDRAIPNEDQITVRTSSRFGHVLAKSDHRRDIRAETKRLRTAASE